MLKNNLSEEIDHAKNLAENFSYENLEDFLFRKGFTIIQEEIYQIDDKSISEYNIDSLQRFAEKELDGQLRPVCVYTLKIDTTELTERSSKKRQFEIAKKILNADQIDSGLFIFHDNSGNFRFSLVFKEVYGTRAEYSYYKRYTFYVSPKRNNKTFILQIGNCDFSTFESIKAAFSVEPVTKEFYKELQAWYYYAMDKVWFPEDYKHSDDPQKDREIRTPLNLIRLITRLIFIWFLKEKGLIPEKLFDEKKLEEIVKDFGKGHNYYNAILQNLFFATLNRPINERGWAYDKGFPANKNNFGVKSLYRYEDKFLIPTEEVLKLFGDIPFINGGLFDCLDKDNIYIDGFSRNEKKQAKIPDDLFFQQEEIVDLSKYGLGSKTSVRGLIEILKSYNFTTDEATPIDQEIALDPELLGKVFENLLAEYNPETSTTARKATGSYYTPREIVDYMIEESLKAYFQTKLPNIPQDKIKNLLSYTDQEVEFSKEERQEIANAINNMKIIDPACGSGAFPMGALHKLVYILQKIDPDNEIWYELQYKEALKSSEEVFKEMDKKEREEMLKEINENFDESINYPDYARKLYLIENCIYGVDIQPIAIQISKLRFFISLILDQKVDKTKENFGIRPLPNLETRLVACNTLIGLERPKQLAFRNPAIANYEEKLRKLRHRYFIAKTRSQKLELQKKDKEIREEIEKLLIKDGWGENTAKKIASFAPYDQNASADWFDPEWMFGVVDGFDIVIGNPPYVRQEKIKAFKPLLEKQKYEVYKSTADLYVYFYEKGYQLLKEKGILAYITSNKWMRAQYGEKLRKFLKDRTTILTIIDFSGYRVFEQTVDTNIIIFKKYKPPKDHLIEFAEVSGDKKDLDLERLLRGKKELKVEQETGDVLRKVEGWNRIGSWQELRDWKHAYTEKNIWKEIPQEKLSVQSWTLADNKVLSIKEKIEKVGKPLKDWDVNIYRGILTGYNEAFIIDTETRDRILANCKDEEERKRTEEIIKPVLRGRDIGRYYYKWAGMWMITIPAGWTNRNRGKVKPEDFFKQTLPSLFSYLISFSNVKGKGKGLFNRDDQGDYWWELRHCDYYPEFEKEKIVWQEIVREPSFTYDNTGIYVEATGFIMTGSNLRYILGLLNSAPVSFFFKTFYAGGGLGEEGYRYKKAFLEALPLPPITPQNQNIANKIIKLVDNILSTKNTNPDADTSQLEREIDQLVYKLYGLTEEEIKIIEGRHSEVINQ